MSYIDGSDPKIFALGVIISAMLYGSVATLALTYIPLLLKTSHTISRRMRNFLLAYLTFIVTVSTLNTVTLIMAFIIGLNYGPVYNGLDLNEFPNGLPGVLLFVIFSSWGVDGFMTWRCAMLCTKEGTLLRRLLLSAGIIATFVAALLFSINFVIHPNRFMIVLFNILHIVLKSVGSPASFIVMQSLVHINVVSSLLIIYQVALGKAQRSHQDELKTHL